MLTWNPIITTPIGVTWVHEAYPWIQIHRTEPVHKGDRPSLKVVYRHPRIRTSKEFAAENWDEAVRIADEFRFVEARAALEETHPVVERPDSVTHWTCPAAPQDDTHHIKNDTCMWCRKPLGLLRSEQLAILQSGALA